MSENTTALKTTAEVAVDDVIEDAIRLLDLHHRLQRAEGNVREDLEVELETQITAIRIHALSAEEALNAVTNDMSDDE